MMPSSVNADVDVDVDIMAGLSAVSVSGASSGAPTGPVGLKVESIMDAQQVETIFGSLAAVKAEETSRPQSPLDIEVPFHDDTELEGAVDVQVLEDEEDRKKKKSKQQQQQQQQQQQHPVHGLGSKNKILTLHVPRMKLGGGCVNNSGRIDLGKLRGYCPVLFEDVTSGVQLGPRDYTELNPHKLQLERRKVKQKREGQRRPKKAKEGKKQPAVPDHSSSSGSDSDLEEMKKKLGMKTPSVASRPAAALPGLLAGSSVSSKKPPPPARAVKTRKESTSSDNSAKGEDKKKKKNGRKLAVRSPPTSADSRRRSASPARKTRRSSSRSSADSRNRSRSSGGSSVSRSPVSSRSSSSFPRSRSCSPTEKRCPASPVGAQPVSSKEEEMEREPGGLERKKNPLFGTKEKTVAEGEAKTNGSPGEAGVKVEAKQEAVKEKEESSVSEDTKGEEVKVESDPNAGHDSKVGVAAESPKDEKAALEEALTGELALEFGDREATKKEGQLPVESATTKTEEKVSKGAEQRGPEEKSGPFLDPSIFTLSRDMRHFRDLLRVELGPNPSFLKANATTIAEFEKIVKKVVDDLDKPANQKPYFTPAKGHPTPPVGPLERSLLEKHGIKKTCVLKLREVSKREKYGKAYMSAVQHYREGAKDAIKRRRGKILHGLQVVKDAAASKAEGRKRRPILDSSDSEDERRGRDRRHQHRDHKEKDRKQREKHRNRHKDKRDSSERKLAFT